MAESIGPEEIENRFGVHKATIEGANATLPKHTELRLAFRELAEFLDSVLPAGREKSTAFTELENASMWSHKAIAKDAPLTVESRLKASKYGSAYTEEDTAINKENN